MKLNNDYLPQIADKKLELALQASGAVLIVDRNGVGKLKQQNNLPKAHYICSTQILRKTI